MTLSMNGKEMVILASNNGHGGGCRSSCQAQLPQSTLPPVILKKSFDIIESTQARSTLNHVVVFAICNKIKGKFMRK